MFLLRGFSVISPLCDVSIHAANIRVPHCDGVMKKWVSMTGEVLGESVSRRTTCPCPRRRRESEVLVGCFVASVSEVSLAFCCGKRLKQSQSGTRNNSPKTKLQYELPQLPSSYST